MPEWFINWVQTPLIVTTALVVFALVWKASAWKTVVDGFMKDIGKKVDKLLNRLPEPTTAPGSPRKLTDFGAGIAREVKAFHWAKTVSRRHAAEVRGKTPYEIDELSKKFVTDTFERSASFTQRLSHCAYEHGIEISEVIKVVEVVLREEFLSMLDKGPTTHDDASAE